MFLKQLASGQALVALLIAALLAGLGLWFANLALAAPSSQVSPDSICTVDDNGPADYGTIQAAVDRARCAVIDVAAGAYVENVVIARNVAIRGADRLHTVVDGGNTGPVFSIENVSATVGLASMHVTHGLDSHGGGIYNEGALTLYDLVIVDNRASFDGGGIYNAGVLTLTSSVVDFNWASHGGGLYNDDAATATIVDSQISGHEGASLGGGIYSRGALTLVGSVIRNNSVTDDHGSGGGIYAHGGRLTVTDSVIHTNVACDGGGLYISFSEEAIIENSQILTNTVGGINNPTQCTDAEGGGILAVGVLTITHSAIRGNNASGLGFNQDGAGGGLYFVDSPNGRMVMIDTEVISNANEGIRVGASNIYTSPIHVEIYASTLSGNDGDGISAFEDNGVLRIRDSQISHNSGTGIYSHGALTLTQSQVSHNGLGGIDGHDVTVRYSTISHNIRGSGVISDGGGIRADGYLKVGYSTISSNASNGCGGGIYGRLREVVEVRSSTISGNAAGTDGGGICIGSSNLTLVNSTVSGNTADGNGGGVALIYALATASLDSATITGNTADQDGDHAGDGGGLYRASWSGMLFSVTNSIIAANRDNSQFAIEKDPDCSGDFVATGLNLVGAVDNDRCTGFGGALQLIGTESDPLDPQLSPLADNGGPTLTHAPAPASPAVDYEFIASCQDVDQRGVARPQDGDGDLVAACDLGAFGIGVCPAPVTVTLSITRSHNDIELSWTDDPAHREYVFYRTTDPFNPPPGAFSMTLHSNSATEYGAIGDPQANYFYRVAGENACGERSALSNRVGEFDFGITPGGNRIKLTLIALPLEGANLPATADEVAAYIDPNGSVKAIAKWMPLTRSWLVRRVDAPFGTPDFAVSPGDVLFVGANSAAPDSFAWVGDVPSRSSITNTLYANAANLIIVPLNMSGHFTPTALGLAADIGGVIAAARWDRHTQSWVMRTAGAGTNFDVYPGYPYAVITNDSAPPSWP